MQLFRLAGTSSRRRPEITRQDAAKGCGAGEAPPGAKAQDGRERLSLREISARLTQAGHVNERGQPFNPQSIRAMIEGPQRRNSKRVRVVKPRPR
jgi:hypothetical protein